MLNLKLTFLMMFLLHLGTLCGSSYLSKDSTSCEIELEYDPLYVLIGCGDEIRVINIRHPGTLLESAHTVVSRRTINLDIRIGNEEKNIIFVLNSIIPINWKIRFNKQALISSPISTFQFWISKGSHIRKDKALHYDLNYFDNFVDEEALINWVVTELGIPDTISTPVYNRSIIVQVAKDGIEACLKGNEIMLINGCVYQEDPTKHIIETHIIEIITKNASHYEGSRLEDLESEPIIPPFVQIFLKSRERKQGDSKVILLLRSNVNVVWKLRTKKIKGTLTILTDRFVNSDDMTEQSIHMESVIEKWDNLSGVDLVNWAAVRYNSYTYTALDAIPRRIDIILDKKNGPSEITDVVGALKSFVNVRCDSNRIKISIPRKQLQNLKMTPSDVWLSLDSLCDPTEKDQVRWDIAAGSCGVKKVDDIFTAMIHGHDHNKQRWKREIFMR